MVDATTGQHSAIQADAASKRAGNPARTRPYNQQLVSGHAGTYRDWRTVCIQSGRKVTLRRSDMFVGNRPCGRRDRQMKISTVQTDEARPQTKARANNDIKRIFDIIFSVIAFLLFLPSMLIVAFLISLDGGPVFFRHRRVGRYGVPFDCIKFRSMHIDANERLKALLACDDVAQQEWKTTFKLKKDPRVTTLGRLLRKSSFDEIPQLFCVLRGDMSLVGPRPIVSEEIPLYGPNIDQYFSCRPGITGLWQVSGRTNTTYEQRVTLDTLYADSQSLLLDIRILIQTVRVVLLGTGAF